MTEPKRRGRPPGSKNKPKVVTAPKPDEVLVPQTGSLDDIPLEPLRDYAHDEDGAPLDPEPRVSETATIYPEASFTSDPEPAWFERPSPSVGIQVIVNFRVALSAPVDSQEIAWPSGWPIPQLNDVLRVSKKKAGRVQFVEYDWGNGTIIISVT